MKIAFFIFGILFNLWIIFLGGAEKIQNTLVGYFEFGIFADNPNYIRAVAWLGLAASVMFIFL